MKPRVGVIDYSVNNINSIVKFLEQLEIDYKVINNSKDILNFGFIILPGVGSFNQGIKNLSIGKFDVEISKHVKLGNYLMGICLGMQLLFQESEEYLGISGLNLIPGSCYKIPNLGVKVPHIGWNEIIINNHSKLLSKNLDKNFLAYFVHSYFTKPKDESIITSMTMHGLKFCSSIEYENIFGFQFHPEKSFDFGVDIFKSFMSLK